MPENVYCLYLDDSGTRLPDHVPNTEGQVDWFALGGVLLREDDKDNVRNGHATLYERWPELTVNGKRVPLHSHAIRFAEGPFAFLAKDRPRYGRFMADLSAWLLGAPVVGHACVINRPGYMRRYAQAYGEQRWQLCKTAFAVVIERAIKVIRRERDDAKLRIIVEKTDRETDRRMKAYVNELWNHGMPFAADTSAKYRPLETAILRSAIHEVGYRDKSSAVMQMADLYLWPMCKARYKPSERSYLAMRKAKRIVDDTLPPELVDEMGIKYSCFDEGTFTVT